MACYSYESICISVFLYLFILGSLKFEETGTLIGLIEDGKINQLRRVAMVAIRWQNHRSSLARAWFIDHLFLIP